MKILVALIACAVLAKCFKTVVKMIGCLIVATVLAAAFAAHIATNLHF